MEDKKLELQALRDKRLSFKANEVGEGRWTESSSVEVKGGSSGVVQVRSLHSWAVVNFWC